MTRPGVSGVAHPPIARNTDPTTSRVGAAEVEASGRRQTHASACLAVIRRHPGKTAIELGVLTGLGHVRAQRRISDLFNRGLVIQGEPRRSSSGRLAVTWWPVESQGELL